LPAPVGMPAMPVPALSPPPPQAVITNGAHKAIHVKPEVRGSGEALDISHPLK